DWRWLFIYPAQHVASINEMAIPVNTPINLYITSDSVMNSIWIPRLAGQIYAMPGMETQLHILSYKTGAFYGSSANISGQGFSNMHFETLAKNNDGFESWLNALAGSSSQLNLASYPKIASPSLSSQISYYSKVPNGLFDYVVLKYMEP